VRQNAVPPAPPADLDFLERFELERTCWDPKDCVRIVFKRMWLFLERVKPIKEYECRNRKMIHQNQKA